MQISQYDDFEPEDLSDAYAEALGDLDKEYVSVVGKVIIYYGVLEDLDMKPSESILGETLPRKSTRMNKKYRTRAARKLYEVYGKESNVFHLYMSLYSSLGIDIVKFDQINSNDYEPIMAINRRIPSGSDSLDINSDVGDGLWDNRGPIAHSMLRVKRVIDENNKVSAFGYLHHSRSGRDFQYMDGYGLMFGTMISLSLLTSCFTDMLSVVHRLMIKDTYADIDMEFLPKNLQMYALGIVG